MLKPFSRFNIYGAFPLALISLSVLILSYFYGWRGLLFCIFSAVIPLYIFRRRIGLLTVFTCMSGLILGGIFNFLNQRQIREDKLFTAYQGETITLYTEALQDSSYYGQKHALWMRLKQSENRNISAPAKGKVRLYIPPRQTRFFRGARLALSIRPVDLQKFDAKIFVRKATLLGYSHPLWALRARIYEKAASFFEKRFSVRSGLFLALLLGDRSALLPIPSQQIRLAGISHLLALSGLHLGLLAFLLFFFFRDAGDRKYPHFIVLPLLLCYVLLTGYPFSLIRAYLSVGLASLLWIRGRNTSSLDLLGFVCLLSLFITPQAFLSLSWQLSFLAVLGILLLQRDYADVLRFLPHKLAEGLSVGLAASATTMPVLAWRFSEAYPQGIPATIILIPLLFFWIISGIAVIVFAKFYPIFAVFDEIVWHVIRFFSFMPAWPNFLALIMFSILLPMLCYFILQIYPRRNSHAL